MQTQHTTNTTIDTLEALYWDARDNNNDALADAIGLALDAAIEVKADADRPLRDLLPLASETPTNHDDAPAHGMQRPRFPLAWCQWCRTIDCECM
jgi:hypothetical protein